MGYGRSGELDRSTLRHPAGEQAVVDVQPPAATVTSRPARASSTPASYSRDVLSDPCNGNWSSNSLDLSNGFDFVTGPLPGTPYSYLPSFPSYASDPIYWPSDTLYSDLVSGSQPALFTVSDF